MSPMQLHKILKPTKERVHQRGTLFMKTTRP